MKPILRQWADPRVVVTLLLIGLFGYAYAQDPSDQAMKGALIAAFAAAYGFWIGASKTGGELAISNAAILTTQAGAGPTPQTAQDAAQDTADAAQQQADNIRGNS